MIIASAIKVNKDDAEFVIMGRRHCSCFEIMFLAGVKRPFKEEQGFVTDDFRFVNRKEALEIAISCGQILEGEELHNVLFSENIFKEVPNDTTGSGEIT